MRHTEDLHHVDIRHTELHCIFLIRVAIKSQRMMAYHNTSLNYSQHTLLALLSATQDDHDPAPLQLERHTMLV